jgi:hypothetical protein
LFFLKNQNGQKINKADFFQKKIQMSENLKWRLGPNWRQNRFFSISYFQNGNSSNFFAVFFFLKI